MKTKYLIIAFFAFTTSLFYGQQVTVTIENMTYFSGVPIPSCGTIDFQDNSSVTIQFGIRLEKPSSLVIGTANLNVLTKKTTNDSPINRDTQSVQESFWSSGSNQVFTASKTITLNASDFNVTGGKLYAEFAGYESCQFSIQKDVVPTFTLSASSSTVPCGSTNPVTFTVNNVYNSPGILSYNWNVGGGWSPSGTFPTTTNTIQLTPTSFPPTQVKATPVLNSVNQPQLTKNVTLSPFSPGYQITGNASLCTTAVYSVNNLPAGISVTGWTSSNTNVATVSSNSNQATLTTVGNGVVNIQASLVNSCGQTAMISKNGIIVGAPTVVNHTINGGFSNMSVNDTSVLSVSAVTGATQYYWTITPSTSCSAGIGPRFSGSNATTITTTSTSVIVNWNDCIGTYAVVAYAKNGCGQSYIATKWVNVFDSSNNPCDRIAGGIKVVPNPVKHGSLTLYKEAPVDPCERISTKLVKIENVENEVKIYDMYSKVVYNGFFNSDIMKITDLKLNSGNYILYVYSSSGETIRQMIIVE